MSYLVSCSSDFPFHIFRFLITTFKFFRDLGFAWPFGLPRYTKITMTQSYRMPESYQIFSVGLTDGRCDMLRRIATQDDASHVFLKLTLCCFVLPHSNPPTRVKLQLSTLSARTFFMLTWAFQEISSKLMLYKPNDSILEIQASNKIIISKYL
jgi:hypothetical protein